ncbi:hypothetical protein [Haloferula sp. A504]|uniref:hypothetical protein n=1 Tax=Haloferula sp. A504 TaxID=3373601 RepID=UPI0031CB466F|nr:hypothetical protein [Verrucomicrobiaceae bacterium E54]
MKRTPILIAAVLVLVAGVIAIAMTQRGGEAGKNASGSTPPPRDGSSAGTQGGFQPNGAAKAAPRTERKSDDRELVEEYGDARTKLARNVSENVVGLLDDVIGMGEMVASGSGPDWGRGDWQMRRILRGTEIELTDAQKEQAEALLADHRQRELQRTKDAVTQLREDPVPLMRMLLAGDARSREELSEADYAALQQANADALGDIINPLDRNNFRGGSPMEDEAFRSGFQAILDPEQATAFQQAQASREEEGGNDDPPSRTDITQMPVMSLESADEAIRSTRQMTTGFKQVMEGMGNLGPILEQQRRAREGEE